jgi:hypothetical protein
MPIQKSNHLLQLKKALERLGGFFQLKQIKRLCRLHQRANALGAKGLLHPFAIFENGNLLQVRVKSPVGRSLGEASVVAEDGLLPAMFAFRHLSTSFQTLVSARSHFLTHEARFYHRLFRSTSLCLIRSLQDIIGNIHLAFPSEENMSVVLNTILEINPSGEVYAHVLGLPGCIVRAQTEKAAVANLVTAIQQYHAWLAAHFRSIDTDPEIDVRVGSVVAGGAASGTGSQVALLPTDTDGMDGQEKSCLLARMEYSRADILEIVTSLSTDELVLRTNPDHRSITEILLHISEAEQWYLSRIENRPCRFQQTNPIERLSAVREAIVAGFSRCSIEESGRITTRAGEKWTLRKAFRRTLEHEREHQLEITQILYLSGCARFPSWMDSASIRREGYLAQISDY